ncbi:MFT2-Corn MFT-like protein [Blyttiomyces sp. JEL0837]|nr:MFT2-Corn MFT-like protein [Blyttiomyces sp. JEL0837]
MSLPSTSSSTSRIIINSTRTRLQQHCTSSSSSVSSPSSQCTAKLISNRRNFSSSPSLSTSCPRSLHTRTYVTVASTGPIKTSHQQPDQTPPSIPAFKPPQPGKSKVYDAALEIINMEKTRIQTERDALKKQLEELSASTNLTPELQSRKQELESKIASMTLELGFSNLENHYKFNQGVVDFDSLLAVKQEASTISDDGLVFEAMKSQRFKTVVLPKLLKLAEKNGLFVDAFPGKVAEVVEPSAILEVNFSNTKWEGLYGHAIPPNWCLYSPTVSITSPTTSPKLYTLLLTDLDRPNLDTQSIEEWAHWLIVDIPVTKRVVIPGGSSPFLNPSTTTLDHQNLTGTGYHPKQRPSGEPSLPGKVILPYIPPHPANSNPRRVHRYLLTVLEQEKEIGGIDLDAIKTTVESEREAAKVGDSPSYLKSVIGDRENEMRVLERGGFSTWGFMKKFGLKVASFGFFTSCWNLYTPNIYTRLGIHEPVYGKVQNVRETLQKIHASTTIASSTSQANFTTLNAKDLKQLNEGIIASPPKFKPPTRLSLEAEAMREAARVAKEKAALKAGNKEKGKASVATTAVKGKKIPRMTVWGSVGVVKSKKDDVASKVVGEVTRARLERRGRYQNI